MLTRVVAPRCPVPRSNDRLSMGAAGGRLDPTSMSPPVAGPQLPNSLGSLFLPGLSATAVGLVVMAVFSMYNTFTRVLMPCHALNQSVCWLGLFSTWRHAPLRAPAILGLISAAAGVPTSVTLLCLEHSTQLLHEVSLHAGHPQRCSRPSRELPI
jgi:hypothetical protein